MALLVLAKRNLISEHVAYEPWIKPLLLLIEYNASDQSKNVID